MDIIDKRYLEKRIDEIVADGKRDIVIYPYGEIGRYAEEYLLHRHGVRIRFALDNKSADGKHIYALDNMPQTDDAGTIYLICSSSPGCYHEIRKAIYGKVDRARVTDIFERNDESPWYKAYLNFKLRPALYDAAYVDSHELHEARYTSAFWRNKHIHIYEDDIIVGDVGVGTMYPYHKYGIGDNDDIRALELLGEMRKEAADKYINATRMGLICRSPGNHATASYSDIVGHGIAKRILYVNDRLYAEPSNVFYQSEMIVLEGLQELIFRYAREAERLFEKTHLGNLKLISENCRRIAIHPPETFLQGLQLVFFIHMGIVMENGCGSFSFGRLDRYLYPLYVNDKEHGVITDEQAQMYLNAFWRKLSEMNSGYQNITIGGGRDGVDESNELTLMCIRAAEEVRGQQPQLSLRICEKTSDKVWDEAVSLISLGMGFPSLFNDDVCVKAMKSKGATEEDAANYSVMGCVELLVEGKEFSHQEGLRFNFVKFLEVLLHGGRCVLTDVEWSLNRTKDVSDIESFEVFFDWYKDELRDTLIRLCDMLDITADHFGKRRHSAFLSAVMDGPLEKGRDIHDNATVYNNLTICGVGNGEIADCLEAIREICFERKLVTLKELVNICDVNFAGHEDIRKELADCHKYGNDLDDVDNILKEILDVFTDTITGYKPKYRDGVMQVGFYTSYFHSDFGKLTAASPDGRYAKMPLSPSLSPMAGMDQSGCIAVFNSANKIDMSRFGNNMALDIKFAPTFFDRRENKEALRQVITAYFKNGGEEAQINVMDAETLKRAKAEPLKYRHVIVRVAGFSARFVDLDEGLQEEIIRRIEHEVA